MLERSAKRRLRILGPYVQEDKSRKLGKEDRIRPLLQGSKPNSRNALRVEQTTTKLLAWGNKEQEVDIEVLVESR